MLYIGRDGLRALCYLFKYYEAVFVLEDLRVIVMGEGRPSASVAAAPLNLWVILEKISSTVTRKGRCLWEEETCLLPLKGISPPFPIKPDGLSYYQGAGGRKGKFLSSWHFTVRDGEVVEVVSCRMRNCDSRYKRVPASVGQSNV